MTADTGTADALLANVGQLARDLEPLHFGPPVSHVYNPLEYALASYEAYLRRYARRGVEAVLVGMNPGPFGMAQTGVPFGDVAMVRDWLRIEQPVGHPREQHPKRPVQGFACPRSEVSGQRLWGWARDRFGTPDRFFERFFVLNYCPLVFIEATGRNRTPDRLPAPERRPLLVACDRALAANVAVLAPRFVIGVGGFASRQARIALGEGGPQVARILHPSPASPIANRGWAEQIEGELRALGIALPPA